MRKIFTLIFILLLALGSAAGYLFLTKKIDAGDLKIMNGQKQLAEGEELLARGQAKLAHGEGKLSEVKNIYHGIKAVPLMGIVSRLPVTDDVFKLAKNEIAEGNQKVAQGKEKIKAGEAQLAEGKLELKQGITRLKQANIMRIGCGYSTIFFVSLLIILGLYWY